MKKEIRELKETKMRSILLVVLISLLGYIVPLATGFGDANAQVGIGTNNPDATSILDLDDTTKGLLIPRLTIAQRDAIASPATGLLVYQTDNAPGFYYNAGTPGTPDWQRLSNGSGSGWSLTGNSGTNPSVDYLGTSDSIPLVFRTNGTEYMRIDTNGNVGIGTDSPVPGVELVRDQGVPMFTSTGYRDVFSPGEFIGRKARGTKLSPTAVQQDDALSILGASGYGETSWSGYNAQPRIYFSAAQNWTDAAQGSYISIRTTAIDTNIAVERLRITDQGNVGIGTTDPAGLIEAVSDQGVASIVATTYRDTSSGSGFNSAKFTGRSARTSQLTPTGTLFDDYLVSFVGEGYGDSGFSHNGGRMAFRAAENWTDSTQSTYFAISTTPLGESTSIEHFRLTSEGNVGIGTTDPSGNLEAVSDQGIASITATTYRDTSISSYNSAKFNGRSARGTMDSPMSSLLDDYLVSFCGYGHTGTSFGSASPKVRLGFKAAEDWSDTNMGTYMMFTTTPIGTTTAAERLRITSEGYVGIGTEAPLDKLHVDGGNIVVDYDYGISVNDGGFLRPVLNATAAGLVITSNPGMLGSPIAFQTKDNYGESARFDDQGNFGINTLNPRYKLDVDGDIRATGSVFYGGSEGNPDGTAYTKPDFVFKEGYKVMNTAEVEKFLKKEGHLPWITSEKKEIEENGNIIDMTRMGFETVETVENLQMQIIELSKLIKEQQKDIELLKNNNNR